MACQVFSRANSEPGAGQHERIRAHAPQGQAEQYLKVATTVNFISPNRIARCSIRRERRLSLLCSRDAHLALPRFDAIIPLSLNRPFSDELVQPRTPDILARRIIGR